METKRQVTKKEFFDALKETKKDVCYYIENIYKYPYNGLFNERNGKKWGRSESTNVDENGKRIYPEITTYFLY